MSEFYERYGTEAQCRSALEGARWPTGFACPACGGAARTSFERGGLRYWQCGACAHQCSLISGTMAITRAAAAAHLESTRQDETPSRRHGDTRTVRTTRQPNHDLHPLGERDQGLHQALEQGIWRAIGRIMRRACNKDIGTQ